MISKNPKIILLLLFIVVFVGAGIFKIYKTNRPEEIFSEVLKIQEKVQSLPLSGEVINGTRVINVKAMQYNFIPDPIVVNKGEKVKFIIESVDIVHGFAISAYGIFEDNILPGYPREIEIIANNAGIFDVACSTFCGAGHREMEAKFIVKE